MTSKDSNTVTSRDLRLIMPVHSRMARAALGLGVRDLAKLAYLSPNTIARFERGDDVSEKTIYTIRNTLEKAGIEFIYKNGGGSGVRLRMPE